MKTVATSARRRMFLARTAASLAMVAAGAGYSWSAHADTLQNVTSSGVLKIGVFQDYPPFGSVGTDMKPRGFDVDFAEVLGKGLGVKVELIPVTGANRIAYLTDRKLDMLMSVGQTPAREKILDFSAAYAPYYIAVYGPPALAVKDPAGLVGKRIATAGGTNEDMSLVKVAPPEAVIKRFDDQSGAISANMLGVRRESVTEAAGHLQDAGLIRYHRGHITVLDRTGLERRTCECYAVVKKEYARLLPAPG